MNKDGGNIITYFCTPDGEVIHLLAGNVDAERLRAAAEWAAETWQQIEREAGDDPARRAALVRQAHLDRLLPKCVDRFEHRLPSLWSASDDATAALELQIRLSKGEIRKVVATAEEVSRMTRQHGMPHLDRLQQRITPVLSQKLNEAQAKIRNNSRQEHLLLAWLPLISLERLQKPAFEILANEEFQPRTERNDELAATIQENARRGRPTLLAITDANPHFLREPGDAAPVRGLTHRGLQTLLPHVELVELTRDELTLLTDDLDQQPIEVPAGRNALFVVLDRAGAQAAVIGENWNRTSRSIGRAGPQLVEALERVLEDTAVARNP